MKFERRYMIFMSMAFLIILNLGINAQNEDSHNDETNLEANPDEGEGTKQSEPENQYQVWLNKLDSKVESEVTEAKNNLKNNLPQTLEVLLGGVANENLSIKHTSIDIISENEDLKDLVSPTFTLHLAKELDADAVVKIIKTLTKWDVKTSSTEITKLLNHEVPAVRIESVKALGHLDGKQSLETLFGIITSETFPNVTAEIYGQIVQLGDDNDLLRLLLRVENQNFSEQKTNVLNPIIECASRYGKQIGVDVLIAISNQARDDYIRLAAIESLLPLLNRENIGVLVDFLWDDNDKIRQQVFTKLSTSTNKSFGYNPDGSLVNRIQSIAMWQNWKQIDDALYWLSSDDKNEATNAFTKIESFGIEALPIIVEAYDNSSDEGKKNILQLVAKYPIPTSFSVMEKALNNENSEVKNLAISSLFNVWKNSNSKKALTLLQNLFQKDPNNIFLVSKLAEAKDESAIAYFTKIIEDPQQVDRAVYYTTPSFFSLLGQHIAAKNETSAKIVDYLSHNGNILALSVLVGHFEDIDSQSKSVLAGRLVDHPEQFAKLVTAFSKEKELAVIDAFCQTIGSLKAKEYFDALNTKVVEFPKNSKIVAALSILATSENTQKLIETFGKISDEDTQKELVRVIGRFNVDANKKFLDETIKNSAKEVRLVALKSYLAFLAEKDQKTYVFDLIKKETSKDFLVELYKVALPFYKKDDYKSLSETFASEENISVKSTLLEILTSLDSKSSSSLLLDQIVTKDNNNDLKSNAISLFSTEKQSDEVLQKLVTSYKETTDLKLKSQLLLLIANSSKANAIKLAEAENSVEIFSALVQIDGSVAAQKFAKTLENNEGKNKARIVELSSSILNKNNIGDLLPHVINDDQDVYDIALATIEKIMKKKMSIEELNLWNQKYQTVTKNIGLLLTEENNAEAISILSENKDIATEELISKFSYANDTQKNKIASLLSSWSDADVYKFMENLIRNDSHHLRVIAYSFLQQNSATTFQKETPVLYILEQNPFAKITLLSFLMKSYPDKYENDLQDYVNSSNEDVQEIFFNIIKEKTNSELYSKLLKQNENTQKKVLAILAAKPSDKNLKILAESIMQSSNEKAGIYLEALSGYNSVTSEAKQTRENFVTWWLEYEKVLAKEQKTFDLLDKLEQNDRLLRRQVKQQLQDTQLSNTKALEYLKDESVSQKAKENLLAILSENPQEKHLDIFTSYAQSDNKPLRRKAIKALAHLGYDKNTAVLESCLQDDDSQVRFFVVRSLGQSSANNANDLLRSSLKDVNFRVREEAFYWLLEKNSVDKELALEMFAENQPPSIQEMAIHYLQKIDEKSVIPKLIFYLDNPFEEIRATAYEALLAISGENFEFDAKTEERTEFVNAWNSWWKNHKQTLEIKELVESFTHEGIDAEVVRKRLADYGKTALPILLENLNDPRGIVRKDVILTLKEMDSRSHTKEISSLAGDNDIQVRQEAIATLEKLANSKIDISVDTEAEQKWQAAIAEITSWWSTKEQTLTQEKEQNTASLRDKVKELFAKFSEENADHSKISKQIFELGSGAVPFIELQLASENDVVVKNALNILSDLNAKQSVPQIIVLLQKDGIRADVESALQKLMGDLPIASVEEIERKEQVKNLAKWWKDERKVLENASMEKIEAILSNVEKEGSSDSSIKALVETRNRSLLEDYLADNRTPVKQAVVSALIDINDRHSVLTLQTYLRGTTFSERQLVIIAIRAITGEEFAPQNPKDEEEWASVYSKVSEWSNNWKNSLQKNLASISDKLTSASSEEILDKTIEELKHYGAEGTKASHELLASKNEKHRLAALKLIAAVSSITDVSVIIPLIDDNNKDIRNLAEQTILKVTQQEKLPSLPVNEVWGVQIAKLQNHWNTIQEQSIDKAELNATLRHLALDEINTEEATKILKDKGSNVISVISPLLKAQDDHIRLGAVKALTLIGNFEQGRSLSACLNDTNISVRQAAYQAVSDWAKEKLPVDLSPGVAAEKTWKENTAKTVNTWLEAEQKAQQEQVTKEMDENAKKIKDFTEIWTLEQLTDVETFIEYLRNPSKEIRDKASDILNDGPLQEAVRNNQVVYNEEATSAEDIEANYTEYKTWLNNKKKDIEENASDANSQLEELEQRKLTISGINNLHDYEDARDVIAEMETVNDPRVLSKFKEILDRYGCDTSKFNPYDSMTKRSDQLYEIETNSLYQMKKRLEKQVENSKTERNSLGDALALNSVKTEAQLEKANLLIACLEKDIDQKLRNEILRILSMVSGENYGSVDNWKSWLESTKENISNSKAQFAKNIEETSQALQDKKSVTNSDDIAKAKSLLAVLTHEDESVREIAIAGLVAVSGDAYGYNAKDNSSWKTSVDTWNSWLKTKEILLAELASVEKATASLTGVVRTGEGVKAVGILIKSLQSNHEELRRKSFTALEEYVRNYAQSEVREGFGYDPAAPLDKLKQPIADWQNWYNNKIVPVQTAEEEKLAKVVGLGKILVSDQLSSSSSIYAAEELIGLLQSDSSLMRKAAFNALQGFSNTSYSYSPETAISEQNNALSLWNAWLLYHKESLLQKYYAKYLQKNLSSAQKRTRAIEMLSLLKQEIVLPEVRSIAVSWLNEEAGKNLSWSSENKKEVTEEFEAWFKQEEPKYIVDATATELAKGITSSYHLEALNTLVSFLNAENEATRKLAVDALNKVSGKLFAFKASDNKETRDKSMSEINNWVTEQSILVPIKEKANALNNKVDVTRSDVKELVGALDHSNENIRKIAIDALTPYLPQPVQYQYNASKKDRERALLDIEAWMDELE